jgi:superfamily I DNA/RNA helicase
MSFNWSNQQLDIFKAIESGEHPVLKVKATAGAAKSSSLVEAIARYKYTHQEAKVLYLVFGNMASKEARLAFGKTAIVSTLHSYAYHKVVKQYGLGEVKPFITWRDISKTVRRPFGKDSEITTLIEEYCKSEFITMDEYINSIDDDSFQYNLIPAAKQILNLMATGKMPVTHSFYLKLYHILVMRGTEKPPAVDRLLIDEAQDLSAMALDIISKIPTKQLVLVGDQNQRIFSFMKLIDGFERFSKAYVLELSTSFRVDNSYAPVIQHFLRKHLETHAVFEGMLYPEDVVPKTKAYLTRTNASLIGKMIELNKSKKQYHLSNNAKVKQMFKLPLAVIYAKPGFPQKDHELKHFQELVDEWGKLPQYKREQQGLYTFLLNHPNIDSASTSAIKLVISFTKEDIIDASEQAEKHKKTACNLQLMTAHTSKGTTRDIIELDPDMDKAVREALSKTFKGTEEDRRSELCLYFVAITRHRHKLIGANYLKELMEEINE